MGKLVLDIVFDRGFVRASPILLHGFDVESCLIAWESLDGAVALSTVGLEKLFTLGNALGVHWAYGNGSPIVALPANEAIFFMVALGVWSTQALAVTDRRAATRKTVATRNVIFS